MLNELSSTAVEDAERVIGDGPVVMINFLWFRDTPDYPRDFADPKPDSRSGYYDGYVGGFRAAAQEVGVEPALVYAGIRLTGLLTGQEDDWDEIAVVRYERFADLRRILESQTYTLKAKPHRFAVVAKWRFIATRGR
nr:hypothetical protein [Jiella mangrovi]